MLVLGWTVVPWTRLETESQELHLHVRLTGMSSRFLVQIPEGQPGPTQEG